MRICWVLPVWVVTLAAIAEAAPRARLTVDHSSAAASQCPDRAAVESAVDRIVGRQLFVEGGDGTIQVSVVFSGTPEAWHALVELRGSKSGVRELDDASSQCTALGEAVAVTVALLVEKEPAASETPTQPAPVAPPPASKAVSRPGQPPVSMRATADFVLDSGLLGTWGYGPEATVDVEFGRGSVGVGGVWLTPQSHELGRGVVDVSLIAGMVRGCGGLLRRSVSIDACGEVLLGGLAGKGEGYTTSTPATHVLVAVGPRVDLRWMASRSVYVALGSGVVFPVKEESFSVGNVGVASRTRAASWTMSAGVGLVLF